MIGFRSSPENGNTRVGSLSINSYNTSSSAFDITEAVETFALDANGYTNDNTTLASDANGNQTYDGVQAYSYDACNRLKTVAHAYRDSGGTLHAGQVSASVSYD